MNYFFLLHEFSSFSNAFIVGCCSVATNVAVRYCRTMWVWCSTFGHMLCADVHQKAKIRWVDWSWRLFAPNASLSSQLHLLCKRTMLMCIARSRQRPRVTSAKLPWNKCVLPSPFMSVYHVAPSQKEEGMNPSSIPSSLLPGVYLLYSISIQWLFVFAPLQFRCICKVLSTIVFMPDCKSVTGEVRT